jgi:ubiquinone/menaquinone biosynthesis C-methylase UbiE
MRIESGQQILDVGCGTGTLALLVKEMCPGAGVVGIDPDPQILDMARRKAERTGAEVRFDLGYADRLPYPDSSFDRVVSSLVFHHLAHETKVLALREAWRVLRPRGELHIADFGRPHSPLMRVALTPVRLFDGLGSTEDNLAGRLPTLIASAGFSEVVETGRMLLGVLCLYRAAKPSVT